MFTTLSFIDLTFIILHPGNCKSVYVTVVCRLLKLTFGARVRKHQEKHNFDERESV